MKPGEFIRKLPENEKKVIKRILETGNCAVVIDTDLKNTYYFERIIMHGGIFELPDGKFDKIYVICPKTVKVYGYAKRVSLEKEIQDFIAKNRELQIKKKRMKAKIGGIECPVVALIYNDIIIASIVSWRCIDNKKRKFEYYLTFIERKGREGKQRVIGFKTMKEALGFVNSHFDTEELKFKDVPERDDNVPFVIDYS